MRTTDWILLVACAVSLAAVGALSQVLDAHLAVHAADDYLKASRVDGGVTHQHTEPTND